MARHQVGALARMESSRLILQLFACGWPTLPQRIRDKYQQHLPGDEAWLIGEHRMSGEKKYHLANLSAKTDLRALAATRPKRSENEPSSAWPFQIPCGVNTDLDSANIARPWRVCCIDLGVCRDPYELDCWASLACLPALLTGGADGR